MTVPTVDLTRSPHLLRPPPITGTTAAAFALDADLIADRYLTAPANRTLTVSGGANGQQLVVDVLASGGNQTITLSGIRLTAGMAAAWTVPSGKVGTLGLRRTGGEWRCLAQTVDQ